MVALPTRTLTMIVSTLSPKPSARDDKGLVVGWPEEHWASMDDLKALHEELVGKLNKL